MDMFLDILPVVVLWLVWLVGVVLEEDFVSLAHRPGGEMAEVIIFICMYFTFFDFV